MNGYVGRSRAFAANLPRRIWVDCRGNAALEAAFIFPLMVVLFVGMVEAYFYMQANSRVTTAAELTADLIAKQKQIYASGVTGGSASVATMSTIYQAAKFMLLPYSSTTSTPQMDVVSILYAAPTAGVNNLTSGAGRCTPVAPATTCRGADWEQLYQGASSSYASTNVYRNYTACTAGALTTSCYCTLDPSTISGGAPACLANQSTVYVNVSYTYNNPVAWFVSRSSTISATSFLKPRLVPYVQLCTTSSTTTACQ